MLIALLAVLGVDLIVLVVLAAGMVSRKRWVIAARDDDRGLLLGPYREPGATVAALNRR